MNPRRLLTFLALASALAVAQSGTAAAQAVGSGEGQKSIHQHRQQTKDSGQTTGTKSSKSADGADDTMTAASQYGAERAAPGVTVPGAAYAEALSQAKNLGVQGGSWVQLTNQPDNVEPAGYNDLVWSNVGAGFSPFVAGRMTALAADGSTIYAGAADGGVWKSTDGGNSFAPIFDNVSTTSIGALAINPADHSLWVGTGEANTNADSYAGQGVFRSTNGGATFSLVGGSELSSHTIYRLLFDGAGKVYAATSMGLYRRKASDTTSPWTLVLKPDPNLANNPYQTSFITDVAVQPDTDGSFVVAADGWRGGGHPPFDTAYNGFYVSTQGGKPGTFHEITPSGDINPADIGRTTFAYAADGSKLYAVVESPAKLLAGAASVLQGVFVSNNGPAGPWTLIAEANKLCNSGSGLTCPSGYEPGVQAWYNQNIIVDPSNANHVIFGLEEEYQSFDGGNTITTVSPYWNYNFPCDANVFNDTCQLTTHPDQHAIAIVGNTLIIGNDGGVYTRPLEDNAPNGDWTDLNATIHALQYYDAEAGRYRGGLAYWGGLQDNGTSLLLPRASTNLSPAGGDGGGVIVNPANANDAVGEYVYLNTYLTTDGGHNFRTITPSCLNAVTTPIPHCDPNPRFIAPLSTDVQDPNHWVVGGEYVWTDTRAWNTVCDNASQRCDWTNIHDTGGGHSITAIAVNGDTIYAAWCGPCNSGGSHPFSSGIDTNFGGAWHTITASNLPNRYIAGLTVDPKHPGHVFVVYNGYSRRWIPSAGLGHVFESTNGGSAFSDISGNLPDIPSDALVYAQGDLALGTDIGAFFATDGQGASTVWYRLGTGLPNVSLNDLRLNPRGNDLLAATHGRGLWALHLP